MAKKEGDAEQAPDELDKLNAELQKPMSKEDAEKALADMDVEKMRLNVIRQKWLTQMKQLELQISDLDTQLIALEMHKAVVFRRALNTPEEPEEK